ASLGLTKRERDHLDRVINRHRRIKRPDGWTHVLRLMSEACSELTGKNPYPHAKSRSGRGRRRGDIKDYPLNHLVRSLTNELRDCGGRLTLDVKGQRGSWIKALDMLRPLLPAGFIPKAPPPLNDCKVDSRGGRGLLKIPDFLMECPEVIPRFLWGC